ncbi:MAG: DUF4397 domain-containing protein [Clostridiaceae bacterium]|nr:DUF4397 domain-containing protein [Clostridiaceae bacterium]
MFNCPYAPYYSSLYREHPNYSYMRVFHASPNSPAIDVYIDDKIAIHNLPYRGFSVYLRTAPGNYNIKVFPTGQREKPVVDTNINIKGKSILTLAAIGTLPNISLLPVLEPTFTRKPGEAYVRFSQLSPNSPNLNVALPVTGNIFTNVAYTKTTDYIPIKAGIHTFNITSSENDERVLHVPNIRLMPNKIYTIYTIGLLAQNPPLQVLIPLDGNSYIKT